MRSLERSTVVLTGATSGLGRHLAERLAATGAHVVIHGRDAERLERAVAEIGESTGNDRVDAVLADLSELTQVDRLAGEIADRCDRIDVLVNNAGVGFGAPGAGRQVSADGVELRFAVNYLAGYHLTRRLIPLLVESAPARVVNVASAGQQPIDFDDPMMERSYDGVDAYRRAKLAQIMFGFDLADELRDRGVTVNALHPATFMDTAMVHEARTGVLSTVEEGSDATMRLIADPDLDAVTGRYFNGTREDRALDQAYDPGARARLRELSDRLIKQALGS
ncbi:MAG TPA: SDR family oxidoreductase [Actinophytocola sp.]|uniref:SDR family oxidoreductase n=1 Tax=Actinophytocola sp. TaxID=1872138 RepID=UPI002DDD0D14|nr:SDR family oxidoreductase [Actinophytocola sp.]HEV2781875.1 SDR family oxidoreductase [Actinophytocola sp.]